MRKVKVEKKILKFIADNCLFLSMFLKEEIVLELMTSLSSELENFGPCKKTENFLMFVRQ